jgi:hypothetical protein
LSYTGQLGAARKRTRRSANLVASFRIEFNRPIVVGDGAVEIPLAPISVAAVAVGGRVLGIELNRPVVVSDGAAL